MDNGNMLLAAPEFWVLVMACVILIVDLFLSEERRGIIHMLAMITCTLPNRAGCRRIRTIGTL